MLAGAQLGITMASLGLGAVAEPAVAHLVEPLLEPLALSSGAVHTISLVIALTIVVFFHMVIGEMAPKNIAIAEPDRTALWLAVPFRVYVTVFRPFIAFLNLVANAGRAAVRSQTGRRVAVGSFGVGDRVDDHRIGKERSARPIRAPAALRSRRVR